MDLTQDSEGFVSSNQAMSPNSPYSPGMRSSLQRQSSNQDVHSAQSSGGVNQSEIQMQNFQEGLPPPPPVGHSWKRIDRWMEDNYEELFENLGEGCTQNDVNELEHELDCTLPMEVRESLQIHDGQERGGRPTGIVFGCMLLDCEEIVQEWQQWRRTNEEYLRSPPDAAGMQPPNKAFAGASTSAAPTSSHSTSPATSNWRQELLARQDSQPSNACQKAYVHAGWIPLARDWNGNNIAIDLAPGPTGKWGQVILMGRDYDCKYVIARSWSAFLANLADDMSTDKWFIDEDSQELKLREFKNAEPAYMDILRWRADQKYGRKQTKRRPMAPLKINSQVKNEYGSLNGFSPYASPSATPTDARGRSPPRFVAHGKGPAGSSPLARVTEETTAPLAVDTQNPSKDAPKLVSLDSPNPNNDVDSMFLSKKSSGSELEDDTSAKGGDEAGASTAAGADELKSVQI